ncbi:hypothetical protein KL949_001102 [Ogataea haglerorum]|nr:hypothetical protein KL913_001106 [Ogataea haglerorum]KAG7722124.1 hypothetical protein KL949_001102 [Ogataea haglerorum]
MSARNVPSQEEEPQDPAPQFHLIVSSNNSGSSVRDHLANERGLLAYIRTALNYFTVSISAIQLFKRSIIEQLICPTPDYGRLAKDQNFYETLVRPWTVIMSCFGLIFVVTNVGRDHLSNERTMLAYLRTSMSFLSLGVGVVRLAEYAIINPLKPLNLEKYPEMLRHDYYIATTYAKPLGALSLAAALLTLAFGMARYCTMFNRIVRSERFQNGAIPAFAISLFVLPVSLIGRGCADVMQNLLTS